MRADRRRLSRSSLTEQLSTRLRNAQVSGRRIGDIEHTLRRRVVANHWTQFFGTVTVACVSTILVTGFLLLFLYTPSGSTTTYDGPYAPLQGGEASLAFDSTMKISFETPGGMLIRQAHHWAALLLPASVLVQLVSTFMTGGFRRPRRGLWLVLFAIYLVSLAGGWSGYALPDDTLSGTGVRITQGVALGIPFVGTAISWLLFGGEYPGRVIEHLYPLHVLVIPALLLALLAMRAIGWWRHPPPQFPGPARSNTTVVGVRVFPAAAARAGGAFAAVVGLIVLVAATITVNPIWLYGPADPGNASAGSQPDWYTGFLDGALRLVPPGWEIEWLGRTWTLAVIVPLAVVTAFLALAAAYPFIEDWASGDREEHHLLQRSRSMPSRSAVGVAGMIFYGVLWLAGGADLLATHFHVALEHVIWTLQFLLVAGPIAGFVLTQRICIALRRRDSETLTHGRETGRIVRLPGGEYHEVHSAIDRADQARLTIDHEYAVALLPDDRGRVSHAQRLRARVSRFLFEERVEGPVTEHAATALDAQARG
jgi:ubiquinol-cytochrome c reductase cytochrome b subunit